MISIACPHCKNRFDTVTMLQNGTFSWPELSAFWFVCPHCGSGSHIRVVDHELSYIRVLGPGPDWEIVDSQQVQGLRVRSDPGFLHVWLSQAHFEFPARVA